MVNYNSAEFLCDESKAVLAVIPDEHVYDGIIDAFKKVTSNGKAWTGSTIDPVVSDSNHTHIIIYIDISELGTWIIRYLAVPNPYPIASPFTITANFKHNLTADPDPNL